MISHQYVSFGCTRICGSYAQQLLKGWEHAPFRAISLGRLKKGERPSKISSLYGTTARRVCSTVTFTHRSRLVQMHLAVAIVLHHGLPRVLMAQ